MTIRIRIVTVFRRNELHAIAGFDPNQKWFGIHPKDQPPHHYRLLGIDLFEGDPEIIDFAAEVDASHRFLAGGPSGHSGRRA